MLATAIIVFREILEAALIVGVVAAATAGVAGRNRWLFVGIVGGVMGALAVAIFAGQITNAFAGSGQELLNATVMFVAVGMLGWHNIWMGRHGREMAKSLASMGEAVAAGNRPLQALAVAVGVAVLREGSEIALFLYGIATGGVGTASLLVGGVVGVVAGVLLGYALYRGLVRLPMRHLFTVTSGLILLLAAGLAAQGAKFLVQAGVLPSLGATLWDSSGILSEQSLLGQVLHTLVGYTARPSGIQFIFYLATLLVIGGLMTWQRRLPAGRRVVRMAAIVAGLGASLMLPGRPAHAQFKIDQPYAEEGEAEVEYEGFRSFDATHTKDNAQGHEVVIGYGVNSFWRTELGGIFERDPADGSTHYQATAWENILQFTEPGQYWADLGLLVEYDKASRGKAPDQVVFEPIIAKDIGPTSNTLDLVFVRDVGAHRQQGVDLGYGFRSVWRLGETISPALEAFGTFGYTNRLPGYNQQDHRVGPGLVGRLALGSLPGNLAYDVGYLFGASGRAAAGTFKANLEYEFHF